MKFAKTDNAELARNAAGRMIAYLNKAIESSGRDDADGQVAVGVALSMAGLQVQAIEVFEQVLSKAPENCEALARLTFAFMRAGKPAAAVETAAQLVSVDSSYRIEEVTTGGQIGAFSVMGLASMAAGRDRAALKSFERAYKDFGDDSVAWAYLAQLREEPASIAVSAAAAANPRFAGLANTVERGELGVSAMLAAASGARISLVARAAHGRPLVTADDTVACAELVEGTAWSVDLAAH
jgi:tetratricopeptide (TPR) repeat protein